MHDFLREKNLSFLTKGPPKVLSLFHSKYFRRLGIACGFFFALGPSGVLAQTSVTINKSASENTAKVLDTYTYYLTVANTGASAATGVTVTDAVPAGISPVSISNGGTLSGGVITWNLPNLSCA